MSILTELLRRHEPTSAELTAALDALELAGKADAITAAKQRRRALLLDGEDGRALDRAERELTEAQREYDRAVALDEELRLRLEKAVLRERLDALADEQANVERETEDLIAEFAEHYAARVVELLDMLDRLEAVDAAVQAVNAKLDAAGSAERIPAVEPRLSADPPLMWLRRFRHAARSDARFHGATA